MKPVDKKIHLVIGYKKNDKKPNVEALNMFLSATCF